MFSSTKTSKVKSPLKSSLDLLFESYALYKEHFWLLVGYYAWMLIPAVATFVLQFFPETNPIVMSLSILVELGSLCLAFYLGVLLILVNAHLIEKKKPVFKTLTQEANKLLNPVAIVLLLQILAVAGGFILLIIPGIIFLIWYSFSQIAAVLEHKKGKEALSFSHNLVKGRFFRVAWRMISGPILLGFLFSTIMGMVYVLVGSLTKTDVVPLLSQAKTPPWMDLLQSVGDVFFVPLLALYFILLYQDLKLNPETK